MEEVRRAGRGAGAKKAESFALVDYPITTFRLIVLPAREGLSPILRYAARRASRDVDRGGHDAETHHRHKNYSSWSFRPWIGLKASGIAFDEEVIPLYVDGSKEKDPGTLAGRQVPVLIDGATHVWESLAILEYAAISSGRAQLWRVRPGGASACRYDLDRDACRLCGAAQRMRHGDVAAASCARNCPTTRRPNITRIQALWAETRARFGAAGPFLFGRFCAADAMYAPVVSRFETYAIDVSAPAKAYMQAMIALPAWQEWRRAALNETWVLPHFEDFPQSQRLRA
jgi:glutathione S-transferase